MVHDIIYISLPTLLLCSLFISWLLYLMPSSFSNKTVNVNRKKFYLHYVVEWFLCLENVIVEKFHNT